VEAILNKGTWVPLELPLLLELPFPLVNFIALSFSNFFIFFVFLQYFFNKILGFYEMGAPTRETLAPSREPIGYPLPAKPRVLGFI
jgi:hypothetical protein